MIQLKKLSKFYHDQMALKSITSVIKENKILGLVGTNGAGKSTLMKIIANQITASSGSITLEKSYGDYNNICLLSDKETILENYSLKDILAFLPEYYPDFNQDVADKLIQLFQINPKKDFSKLSKGQKGKFNLVIALSSRAYITLLDETYISLDAPSRHLFFNILLEEYHAFPRTFIISTHYVDEVNRLFDDIMVLNKGEILVHEAKDILEEKCLTLLGPTAIGDELLKNIQILHKETIGKRTLYSIFDDITSIEKQLIAEQFEISFTPLEKWFIHLIQKEGGIHE